MDSSSTASCSASAAMKRLADTILQDSYSEPQKQKKKKNKKSKNGKDKAAKHSGDDTHDADAAADTIKIKSKKDKKDRKKQTKKRLPKDTQCEEDTKAKKNLLDLLVKQPMTRRKEPKTHGTADEQTDTVDIKEEAGAAQQNLSK